jgi:hypothetical protein
VSTRDEDAAWQQIVENYGERPDVSEAPVDSDPADDSEESDGSDPRDAVVGPDAPETPRADGPEVFHLELYDESFVLHYAVPPVLTGGLVVAFLASFGYLVATMEPHDPDDDGARV